MNEASGKLCSVGFSVSLGFPSQESRKSEQNLEPIL